jgi:Icc-related predicted phosphoesterase
MLGLRSKKRARRRSLRIFFATDVHGSDRCFRKFLAAATVYEANILLLGGDVAGKGLVPIHTTELDSLCAEVHGVPVTVAGEDEHRLRDEINRGGFYGVRMDDAEMARMREDAMYVDEVFRREITAQIQRWCNLAEERLPSDVRCIITPGNDDPSEVDVVLDAAPRIECPERRLCDLGPVLLASLGDVTPTPWNTEREYSEEELDSRISEMLDAVPPGRRAAVNFHCPPYGSGLDVAPELDENLKQVIRGGRPSVMPVGSKAVREAIKRYQPVVGLHGHIHESHGAQKIGGTLCLNPGSDYSSDVLRGALVDLADNGDLLDFVFTTG